jgi:hypothetical protein
LITSGVKSKAVEALQRRELFRTVGERRPQALERRRARDLASGDGLADAGRSETEPDVALAPAGVAEFLEARVFARRYELQRAPHGRSLR